MWSALVSVAWPAVREVLLQLGIYIGMSAMTTTLLTSMMSQSQGYYDSLPSQALAFCNLVGVPTGLGMISGAIATRITATAVKSFRIK